MNPNKEDLFKMNIDMLGPFWRDWEWSFRHPLTQYNSHKLYSILHQWRFLGLVLNARWVSTYAESRWIHRLHGVWSIRVSYKLQVFAWLVIFQDLPSKAHSPKVVILMVFASFAQCQMKHILLESSFTRSCWDQVQSQLASLLQGYLHWQEVLLGDSRLVIGIPWPVFNIV